MTIEVAQTSVSFRVEDMTCGHCVGTITNAVEKSIAGTTVQADLATHTVTVSGSSDAQPIADIITDAGYTPQQV